MYKQQLGISVYPEHFSETETENYLKKCYSKNIKSVFFSLLQFGKEIAKETFDLYMRLIALAKKIGYYIILDISDQTLDIFKIEVNNLSAIKNYGIDCIRLDAPLLAKNIADATYEGIDIQLNVSNNDNLICNVLDFKPNEQNLFGSHNFYPLDGSAPGKKFFLESSRRFSDKGISTACFAGSNFAEWGPQIFKVKKVVSCELMRKMDLISQIKWALSTNLISTVLVGNQPMSDSEIEDLKKIKLDGVFNFRIHLEKNATESMKEITAFDNHYWRGDASDNFIRSTQCRVKYRNDMQPLNNSKKYSFGDVCIINSNNKNYQNELVIILNDNYEVPNNSFNKVGSIYFDDLELLRNMKPWNKFRFEV